MKRYKHVVIGGIESKVITLVMVSMLLVAAVFLVSMLTQNSILSKLTQETNKRQLTSMTDTTTGVLDMVITDNMDRITELQAQQTDKLFHDAIFGEEQRRIVLCTTLRDFDEDVPEGESMSENCQMQELFLRCVARQTYQNFRLVLTTFGEKNDKSIHKAVDAIFDDPEQREKVIIVREDLESDYRFSMTSVLLNGIEEARKGYDPIVVWCNGDIVLQGNLFETLDKLYADDLAGTSHPSLMTLSMKYFREQAVGFPPVNTTFDMMFFAARLLQDEEVLEWIKKYRFYDRGLFSAFLVALALRAKTRALVSSSSTSRMA